MTDYRLISSDSHVTMPDDAWQTVPRSRSSATGRPSDRADRRGRLPPVRGQAHPDQDPQQSRREEARGVQAQRPQARRAAGRRVGPGRADQGHGHRRRRRRGALRRRAAAVVGRGAAAQQCPRLQPLALRLRVLRARTGCSGWPRSPSTRRSAPSPRNPRSPPRSPASPAATSRCSRRGRLRRPEVGPDVGGVPRHRTPGRAARRRPPARHPRRRASTRARPDS